MGIELNLIGYVCPIPVFETRKKLLKKNKKQDYMQGGVYMQKSISKKAKY